MQVTILSQMRRWRRMKATPERNESLMAGWPPGTDAFPKRERGSLSL